VLLREQGSRRTLLLRARSTRHPSATAESGQSLVSCAWAGFESALDVRRLRRGGRWVEGTWRVTVAAVSGGRPARSRLKAGAKGSGAYPPAHWVAPDVRVVPQIKDQHLYLAVERVRVRLAAVRLAGDGTEGFLLDLALAGELPSEGAVLVLTQANSGRRIEAALEPAPTTGPEGAPGPEGASGPEGAPGPEGTRGFTARIPAAALTAARGLGLTRLGWNTRLHLADGSDLPVVVDERADCASVQLPLPPGTLHAKRSPQGYLQLTDQPAAMVLHSVSARTRGALELELSCPGPRGRLVLQRDWTKEELTVPLPKPGPGGRFAERFQVLLPLHPEPAYEGENLALAPGDWQLLHRPDDPATAGPAGQGAAEDTSEDTPVLAAPALHRSLPVEQTARGARTALDRVGYDRAVLTVHPPLDREADSAYGRRRLQTVDYPAALRRPLREAVLFDNFKGGPYGDSPWAIHREMLDRGLDVEHLWAVRGPHVAMPPSARPVLFGSAEWHEALARSRYVVGSTHFPPWIRRREGQVIVQTWHGTPLKRIGFDFDNAHLAGEDYLSEIEREAPHWSLLLSPNRFSTPLLRRAFRYQGEVLESGYPRNDLLYAADREKTADAVRRRLGLPPDKKVVLYAPTWREDRRRFNGGVALDLCLDLDHARRELGRDHVLLIRPHTHVVEKVPNAGDGFVWDVASYPDVTELFLVADVLVTDYSSLMFDFAHTGRPMLFFTYDLEWYRDTLRGFYLDFEREAPGPLLSTSAEVVGALRNLGATSSRYADAYAGFRERYCDLDDGRAAARVVDRMLELAR
jgi:CDP-glycerol glycerophosphotransferase